MNKTNLNPLDRNLIDRPGRVDRLARFFTDYRIIVLTLSVIAALVVGFGATRIKGEVILQDMFPFTHPYLHLHGRFSQVFGGGGSTVVVAVKVKNGDIFTPERLTRIQRMTEEIEMWDEVYRPLTVSIGSRSTKVVKTRKKGEISVEPLMWPEVPRTPEAIEVLKKELYSNPAYKGSLISHDGTAALILTEFRENISYERVFELVQKLTKEHTDAEMSVHTVGFPIMMGWIYSYKPQIFIVFGVSITICLAILWLIFRSPAGIIAPIGFSMICTLWGLGFIGWSGINFSPLLYVLAFLVGARMISHSVQITQRYFEEYQACHHHAVAACYETMRKTMLPNTVCVLTEALGFLVLFIAKIGLMMQVATILSVWMVSLALAGILTPIICSLLPMRRALQDWETRQARPSMLDRLLVRVCEFSIGRGRWVVLGVCAAMFAFSLSNMGSIKIGDPTPGTPLLFDSHPYNRDQALIDASFDASSDNLMLFYEGQRGSVYDPEVLKTFEAFSRHMRDELPDLYKTSASVINLAQLVNVTFHDGDMLWYQTPRDEALLTALMGYVRENAARGTTSRFMDASMERAQITLFFSDHTSDNLARIHDAAYAFFKTHPTSTERGHFLLAGGRIGLEMAVNDEMKRSHFLIDGAVLLAILLLCSLYFRSLLAGVMLTVPLILANLVAFAYMAKMGIGLSINTLPIAAVGVGVGVDFALYLYAMLKWELPRHEHWRDALIETVRTSGKGVVFTGFTTILPILSWYFISDLRFQAQMGFFLAMIMATNVVLAITLHPLMIYMLKPKFLLKRSIQPQVADRLAHDGEVPSAAIVDRAN